MTSDAAGGRKCPICGHEIPPGRFCGACGADLERSGPEAGSRRHAFAAHPGQHVFHLSLVSTLLPHLPHRRTMPFRVALGLGAALLLALGALRLTGPAVAAAAVIVPALYLLYLWEVEVYGGEPLAMILATFAPGALLGVPYGLIAAPIVSRSALIQASGAGGGQDLVPAGVLLPLLAQVLMLAGAFAVYAFRHRYDEVLDGFTFGAASALGFTFATTLIDLYPLLQHGLFSTASPLSSGLDLLQRGLLLPLVNASTSGLIGGALWLRRAGVRRTAGAAPVTSVPATVGLAVVVQVGLGIAGILLSSSVLVTITYALAVVVLLLWVRLALHHMLLAEAAEVEVGPPMVCTHCSHEVPRMPFCPNCGIATRATPKVGSGRHRPASEPA